MVSPPLPWPYCGRPSLPSETAGGGGVLSSGVGWCLSGGGTGEDTSEINHLLKSYGGFWFKKKKKKNKKKK